MTSSHYIREVQYRDDSKLAARQSMYVYQRPQIALFDRALELAELDGDESVLDVGCGNGNYLAAFERRTHRGARYGMDMAEGMLPAARTRAPEALLLVGDAQRLPFPDASFERALSMHMLYHLPDRAAAIAELRRVLRTDGIALVITNSVTHLSELDDLVSGAVREVGGIDLRPMERSMRKFSVESAPPELAVSFDHVELHHFDSDLFVPEVEPLIDYVTSMRALLVAGPEIIASLLDEIRARAAETIEREGSVRIRTRVGCFVCRS